MINDAKQAKYSRELFVQSAIFKPNYPTPSDGTESLKPRAIKLHADAIHSRAIVDAIVLVCTAAVSACEFHVPC